jgi:uncharacterized protein
MEPITSQMIWEAVIGGGLMGISAILLYIFNARPIGVSGAFNFSIGGGGDVRLGSFIYLIFVIIGGVAIYHYYAPVQTLNVSADNYIMALSGALIGIGAAMGSGCTSGHGICGIGRLSVRSLVATLTFIATGAITVYLTNM